METAPHSAGRRKNPAEEVIEPDSGIPVRDTRGGSYPGVDRVVSVEAMADDCRSSRFPHP